ncbi:Hypothetical predicted protein [Prunus dulcis]|uniref:Uncharacterized protein n=1 Tax=Prunus dulcis TaxID=3755 RepID=A0A5E4EXD7_PRUDU|nr:Hypothetical predicted protein [Prunus dulcis]
MEVFLQQSKRLFVRLSHNKEVNRCLATYEELSKGIQAFLSGDQIWTISK